MAIKNSFTLPEYTYDNFKAQMDWNREIKNNKQGYLAVDIMPMKDFYDAGGYAFVNDYKAELSAVDAAYDRALPAYGAQGEQMAKAGLQGSGYSDYLAGQAYATRAAGQAVARQNAMANSNSFRAAYNEYVRQQKEKREANLQGVIERAQSVNMNPDNFVEIAKKLGIPEEDAKRGKEALIAYYMGLGKVDSRGKPITGGTASSTTGNTNAVWGTPVNEYGVTEEEMGDVKSIQNVLQGGLTGYTDKDGNVLVPQAPTLDAQISSQFGGTVSKDDPRMQAAIKLAQTSELGAIVGNIDIGNYGEAKKALDSWKTYGLFGDTPEENKGYQDAVTKLQDAVANTIASAYQSGSLDSYAEALTRLGYNTDKLELSEDNAEELMQTAVDSLVKDGMITKEQGKQLLVASIRQDLKLVSDADELHSLIVQAKDEGLNEEEIAEALNTKIQFTSKASRPHITMKLPNGEDVSYRISESTLYPTEKQKANIAMLQKKNFDASDKMAYVDGELYYRSGSGWKVCSLVVSGESSGKAYRALTNVIAAMLPEKMVIIGGAKNASKGITE